MTQQLADLRDNRLPAALLLGAVLSLLPGCGGGGGGTGSVSVTSSDSPVEEIVWGDGPNSVELKWQLPTQTEDGEGLTNLAGVAVYIRTGGENEDLARVPVGMTERTVIRGIGTGSFGFRVAAYSSTGLESLPSEEVVASVP